MTLPGFLRRDEFGEIFLVGHRVTLYHVIKDYKRGQSVAELAAAYPTLAPALIDKVITFYLANPTEVERYVDETRTEIERQASMPSRGPSAADLRRRLEAKRKAESA